jgi:hypothetical protein
MTHACTPVKADAVGVRVPMIPRDNIPMVATTLKITHTAKSFFFINSSLSKRQFYSMQITFLMI